MEYTTLGIDINKNYRIDFDNYDPSMVPKLSEENEQKWHKHLYYQGCHEVPEDQKALYAKGNTMDPAKALMPEVMDRLAQPGHFEGDLGYCLLPNGIGYGSCYCKTGITFEMADWYRLFKAGDQLGYQCWFPGSHMDEVTEEGYGPREDVGFGVEVICAQKVLNYKDLGFTRDPKEVDPLFAGIIAINSYIKNEQYPEIEPRAFVLYHYIRKHPDGECEYITHIYEGGHFEDGKLVVKQNIEPEVCLEVTRRMLSHCIHERNNIRHFVPQLYEKYKDMDLSGPEYNRGFSSSSR